MAENDLADALRVKVGKAANLLGEIASDYAPATLANSFGVEDMVLMDLICRHDLDVGIFSLDTGRLPEETYALVDEVQRHYGHVIDVYFPNAQAVERFVQSEGVNAFYRSVDLRKRCCGIRKVEPLKRALSGRRAWVTGLRREQAPTRKRLPLREWDATHGLEKFNPLADWTHDDVWEYVHELGVPYNKLHDRGYPSIGCAPCTRAITVGEDIRAGRWWWENPDSKECGLHVKTAFGNR